MPLSPDQQGESPLLQLEMEIMQKRIYFGSTKSSLSVNRQPGASSSLSFHNGESTSTSVLGGLLQQQQQYLSQMSRYLENASDKESIYLFESVSTNSRLLDRLEMESIYSNNEDDVLNGKLLDKLHLPPTAASNTTSRSNSFSKLSRTSSSQSRKLLEVNLRSVSQAHKVLRMSNASIDSLHADFLAASTSLSLLGSGHIYEESDEEESRIGGDGTDDDDSENEFTFNNSSSETLEIDRHPKSADDALYLPKVKSRGINGHGHSESISHLPNRVPDNRPLLRSKSTTNAVRGIPLQGQRRIISDNPQIPSPGPQHRFMELGVPNSNFSPSVSTTSVNTFASPNLSQSSFVVDKSNEKLTPESRTNLALQLRQMGKHREASYQLQIAANTPNNYPRAMYLYAMALKEGHGVKQNDRHCLKWLCRCILYESFGSELLGIELEKLCERTADDLVRFIIKLDANNSYDPIDLFKYYKLLPPAQFQKAVHNSANINLASPALTNQTVETETLATPVASNNGNGEVPSSPISLLSITSVSTSSSCPIGNAVLGNCFHELGNCLLTGNGLMKKEEVHGIKMISRAASMGHTNSMLQLGELWCHKSKHHKKDLYLASAWLRLGELFGAKSIGNSWIYKEKYLKERTSLLH